MSTPWASRAPCLASASYVSAFSSRTKEDGFYLLIVKRFMFISAYSQILKCPHGNCLSMYFFCFMVWPSPPSFLHPPPEPCWRAGSTLSVPPHSPVCSTHAHGDTAHASCQRVFSAVVYKTKLRRSRHASLPFAFLCVAVESLGLALVHSSYRLNESRGCDAISESLPAAGHSARGLIKASEAMLWPRGSPKIGAS